MKNIKRKLLEKGLMIIGRIYENGKNRKHKQKTLTRRQDGN